MHPGGMDHAAVRPAGGIQELKEKPGGFELGQLKLAPLTMKRGFYFKGSGPK
jgi:hypothetical protein